MKTAHTFDKKISIFIEDEVTNKYKIINFQTIRKTKTLKRTSKQTSKTGFQRALDKDVLFLIQY